MNKGFLGDEGINRLGAVQEFYEKIEKDPSHPTLKTEDMLDFCPDGMNDPAYKAVITLVKRNSVTKEVSYHAVRVRIS